MFKLETPKKRGRGIPKGEHKIIRTAWRTQDTKDMDCYNKISNVAKTKKMNNHKFVKSFLKRNVDKIE